MSGIAGILRLDGGPLDRAMLLRLTSPLEFCGLDSQQIWVEGALGLGLWLWRTNTESPRKARQPQTDARAWIVADARLDARAALVARLQARDLPVSAGASDAELILAAWAAWGERCTDYLLGDFSFALWDLRARRLFCARDHFGVKPFFYALGDGCLLFSNTLDCLRAHPAVSDRLNDQAIADFLCFDHNTDAATSAFADILRLPPAHALSCLGTEVRVRRYWTLQPSEPIRFAHRGDYLARFRELLDASVGDRLRADRGAILMGGGLDSTTVAAVARRRLGQPDGVSDLRAYTTSYEHLIPHQERKFAALAANKLSLPLQIHEAGDYRLYERWNDPALHRPEPLHNPLLAAEADQLKQISVRSQVALTGYGGDPALACLLSFHVRQQLRAGQFLQLFREAAAYLLAEGRGSRLYLRTRLGRWMGRNRWRQNYPVWLEAGLERRLHLPERWEEMNRSAPPREFVRPEAAQALLASMWPFLFEEYDPGVTRLPLEVRHPFFDLRLVNFLLALPALPWCSDKQLLREAMRGELPEAVRLRPKSPLPADPIAALLAGPESAWVDRFKPTPGLARYVDLRRLPAVRGENDPWHRWVNLRPLSLNNWLHSLSAFKYKSAREEENCEPEVTQIA